MMALVRWALVAFGLLAVAAGPALVAAEADVAPEAASLLGNPPADESVVGMPNMPATAFDPDQPVDITADEANLDQANRTLMLSGNVVAKQGAVALAADTLTVYYLKTEEAQTDIAGKVDSMVAEGHVVVKRPGEIVKGSSATYKLGEKKILMAGNVVATRGGNVVKGDKIVVDLEKETIELQSSSSDGRVKARIVPPGDAAKP